jgi:oligopeptide transport system substrate-binding protein
LTRKADSAPLTRRSFVAGIAVLGIAALAEGCRRDTGTSTSTGASAAGSSSPGVLRYPITAEPTTFDPALVRDGYTIDLLQNVYEGLIGWNEKNEVAPLAARELPRLSADGRTYTFVLREGLKFHNGRAVTADDVRYSIVRSLDPKLASTVALDYLSDIVGASEFNAGKASDVKGIRVVDPQTLSIEILAPRAYFLGKLTYGTAYIVAKEEVEKGEKTTQGAPFIDSKNAVGTGPFKLTEYTPQGKVVLEANAEYWAGKPALTHIERPVVLDAKTMRNLYDSGELDYIDLPRADYANDRTNPALKNEIKMWPRAATWYVGLNQAQYPPFKDKRIRQAVAYAIDKDAIIANVLLGVNERAESFVPDGIFSHDPAYKGLGHDPEKAKALLAAAGFANGAGLPPLTLYFREQIPEIRKTAEILKEQLAAVGIALNLDEMEWGAFLKMNDENKQDAFHMRWSADYLDPQDFLSLLLSTTGTENHARYSNPQFDALCRQADAESDQAKRTTLYRQADQMAMDDAAVIPIYYQKDLELMKPYVTGIRDSLFGHLPHTKTAVA